MKRFAGCAGVLIALAILAAPAYADDGNKGGKGGEAPEAASVLMLPIAAAGAVGLRAFLRRDKQPK